MPGDINPECEDNGTGSGVQVGFNNSSTLRCLALRGGGAFPRGQI